MNNDTPMPKKPEVPGILKGGLILPGMSGEHEQAFLNFYRKRTINQVRHALLLGIFLFAALGALDPYVVPGVIRTVWMIRYFVIVPVLLVLWILTYVTRKAGYIQVACGLAVMLTGIAIVFMMAIDTGLGNKIYYGGIMLCIFYGSAFLRLTFILSVIASWSVTFFYIASVASAGNIPLPVLMNNTFFLCASNIVAMSLSYILETHIRTEYEQAVAMKMANLELHRNSMFDSLTKIPNRRFFDMRFKEECNRMRREDRPLSLVIFDIDCFKNYNDRFGHHMGDQCLVQVASQIKKVVRRSGDFVARIGGEEFAVILSNTRVEEAIAVADNMRQEVRNMEIPHPSSTVEAIVTISGGVASCVPSDRVAGDDLFGAADMALYSAKTNGKDRVEAMVDIVTPPPG